MTFEDLHEYFSTYVQSQKIFNKFENNTNKECSLISVGNEIVMLTRIKVNRYHNNNFIFSIKLLNDNIVEIKSTIKTPCFTDEYNVIIPQLIRKIRSKGFNEYTFKKQEISTSCYGSNHKSSYLVVSLNNDDDLMEKICLLLSIVNVFNEKFYDKLINHYNENIKKEGFK